MEANGATRNVPIPKKFLVDEFMLDTASMTPAATGVYIRLLCYLWKHCHLPNSWKELARIGGCTGQAELKRLWAEIRPRFETDCWENYYHAKLEKAELKALDISDKRAISGRKGGKAGIFYAEGFELFWQAYPPGRRNSKGYAYDCWEKAIHLLAEHQYDPERFLVGKAQEYAESEVGKSKYAKMPSTWLNQRCWDDDPRSWQRKADHEDPRGNLAVLHDFLQEDG